MTQVVHAIAFGPFRRSDQLSEALLRVTNLRTIRCALGWPRPRTPSNVTRIYYNIINPEDIAQRQSRALSIVRAAVSDVNRYPGNELIIFFSDDEVARVEYDIAVRYLRSININYTIVPF